MRIRYAYRLELEDGKVAFKVIDHIKSEEEVKEMFADKLGCVKATFHERVKTGFRLNEDGTISETGLVHKDPNAPTPAPAKPSKKAKKSKKAE